MSFLLVSLYPFRWPQNSTGQRVKHEIHQNKINNERVFLLESAGGKKSVCCQLACGDSKHSRAGLEFGLAIICHSCDNACWPQVCGWPHCVYLEMNLKSGRTGKAHKPRLNKNREWSLQRGAGWEGESNVIALAPLGQGANTGVNALRISSNTHLLILRGMCWGDAIRYGLCWLYPGRIQYLSLVMVKEPMLTAALHLSNKVTVYLLDHRRRWWDPKRWPDQMTLKNACARIRVFRRSHCRVRNTWMYHFLIRKLISLLLEK